MARRFIHFYQRRIRAQSGKKAAARDARPDGGTPETGQRTAAAEQMAKCVHQCRRLTTNDHARKRPATTTVTSRCSRAVLPAVCFQRFAGARDTEFIHRRFKQTSEADP
jgi:hypothetical protein